ncbi:NADAR family protein [Microbulbifer thermotolerans]|uniref:NADAR family protein n=1 Tax=Microbulbifer thermotolerans TaxID=252514 RepID=UPI00224AFFE0|nr:NADAR family protein [Microbulbifer thermotolerans]MCX2780605.1 NADAR family protein [Microbulbifer thermotolerans]MCX2783682.1 NADAR family protein [Microbulbifer thermotolerans]MCX2806146.1 NADAR family protein [Microbulbifer thermotolerans]
MANNLSESNKRSYKLNDVVSFKKTNERWGGLSNMAPGYPLFVLGFEIRSSEALYQACRFPHMPEVQHKIILQNSPMTAKMVGKPFRNESRSDWEKVRIKVMKWVLRVKLAQNWDSFSRLLLDTGDMPIVEISNKDSFWGAKPLDAGNLSGVNALGRLLMELREKIRSSDKENLLVVPPLKIEKFSFMGEAIGTVSADDVKVGSNHHQNRLDV